MLCGLGCIIADLSCWARMLGKICLAVLRVESIELVAFQSLKRLGNLSFLCFNAHVH